MALLVPTRQKFMELSPGNVVAVTEVMLQTTSDTLTVPRAAHQTASAAVGRLLPAGASACTVT